MKTNNTDFVYFDRSIRMFPLKNILNESTLESRRIWHNMGRAHYLIFSSLSIFLILHFSLFYFILCFVVVFFFLLFHKPMTSVVSTLQNRWNFIQYFFSRELVTKNVLCKPGSVDVWLHIYWPLFRFDSQSITIPFFYSDLHIFEIWLFIRFERRIHSI